jgi:hypothetical protein
MLNECHNCKFADEYLCWWWYPHFNPTCVKGLMMNKEDECEEFRQIGRLSR